MSGSSTPYLIEKAYGFVKLLSDGANWQIVSAG
jgi:hypothetical protein